MPELPEVETVRRALESRISGRAVVRVEGRPVPMRRPLEPEHIAQSLGGRRLTTQRRRGKFLLMDSDSGGTLLVHLGMSGRLLLEGRDTPRLPHTHLILGLENDLELRFVDPRRFGLAVWLDPGAEAEDPSLKILGPEPLDPSLPEILPAMIHRRRAPLKALLLDQRMVAGVGNIYATEALWRAGIRPTRRGHRTSLERLERLVRELQAVLYDAIEQGGTTIRDFASPAGDFGSFVVRLKVYGREGADCPRCGDTLSMSRIGNRSSVFCPRCQR
jgi:formamidopyrimidine-DNA glycosylase